MDIEEAINTIKSAGLDVELKDYDILVVFSGVEKIGDIKKRNHCHHIRQVDNQWCIYDGGQLPKYEFSKLDFAVDRVISLIGGLHASTNV